jgi:hypothetical protein
MEESRSVEELHGEYQDLLMVTVALNGLIRDYKERLSGAPRPLPTLFQRFEDDIPRCERLLKANNEKKRALQKYIMGLEEQS